SSVPAPLATLEAHEAAPEPPPTDDDGWSLPESATDDPTTLFHSEGSSQPVFDALQVAPARPPVDDSPAISLVDSDPITEALLNTDVDALLAPAAPLPQAPGFVEEEAPASESHLAESNEDGVSVEAAQLRRPIGRQVLFAAVIVLIALAAFVRLGLALN
ncbi:MAG TPA: hypothetical protein VEQ58_22915, partial [Polyangiaceae bacterium]|nr:hypothetical protein [Polyangiaceae bacterium]